MKELIHQGNLILGIELGSTRIKAVLLNENQEILSTGSYGWENKLINGIWTYDLEGVWKGLQSCYADLKKNVKLKYDIVLSKIDRMGISAMMHGYLVFDENDQLLVPFRTWRNGLQGEAANQLTELFQFNIPERWSIAHLYQAILNNEPHVQEISFQTTLAGYIHWKLTGEKVLGIGDASGMFPINIETKNYHSEMLNSFENKIKNYDFNWKLEKLLPKVLVAGQEAGYLSEEGASLLDPMGDLESGSLFCSPEGDAGTGMVATNSIAKRTGNISAGTSIFSMIVLEHNLSKVYPEIDMVTTPSGELVAMVHANNCTSDINNWVKIFHDFSKATGLNITMENLYSTLFKEALKGDMDAGRLLSYGYLSGENITDIPEGRPLFVRMPNSNFNLANLMRTHIYTAFGALSIGMKTLTDNEQVKIDNIQGHGGIFKTKGVAQQILASALNSPVSIMENAGEGGAWGIALLADYLKYAKEGMALDSYLNKIIFFETKVTTLNPNPNEFDGFSLFLKRYQEGLPIELSAIDHMK